MRVSIAKVEAGLINAKNESPDYVHVFRPR